MPAPARHEFFAEIQKKRGYAACEALKARAYAAEPYYVLGLPDRPTRQAYAAEVERYFGREARQVLEAKVRDLWHRRRALANEASNPA
jgi:hypothetical protein